MRKFGRQMGVALRAVQFAVETGRIEIAERRQAGKRTRVFIDLDTQGPAWKQNGDPGHKNRATRGEMAGAKGAKAQGKADGRPAPDPAAAAGLQAGSPHTSQFQLARTAREAMNAKITELKYRKEIGDLVELEKVKALFFSAAHAAQQNLMNIPARVSAIIAAKTDEREIYNLLETEIIQALENLSNASFDDFVNS